MTRETGTETRDPGLQPCKVVCLNADEQELVILLEADGHDIPVHVPVPRTAMAALPHLAALHGHASGCRAGKGDVHVGLLKRSLRASGSWPLCVVVRPGDTPAFWLRVVREDGPVDVDLGILDAAALLMSRQVPVVVDLSVDDPWARTFATLLDDGDPSC